ncbi:MAG: hypothetical protein HW416_1538 [Chloroflexi bacterium]|nr:hypothetical protein [Chloroflexota bacterium]
MQKLRSRIIGLLVMATMLVAACAPSAPTERVGSPGQAPAEPPRAPKTLTATALREPASLHLDLSPGTTTSGSNQPYLIVHNYLTVRNEKWTILPQLAEELISIEKGTWRVNADGTMDTTWKLRPNIKWHDGVPFTADDLVFSLGVYKDPEVPNRSGNVLRSMESAEAPDPRTFVLHWSSVYVDAARASGLIPLPRHLAEAPFKSDKAGFLNSPLLGPEFVGLGAYKLSRWEPGVQMEFARFDDYYLGRPPFDTVTLKFIGDPNGMVAAILSGNADVVLPLGVDTEVAEDLKRRWEGTGNQVTGNVTGAMRFIIIQHRPEYARPQNGFTNRLVRQAFMQATDRQAVAELATLGYSQAMDGWFPPTHQLAPLVQSSIPQYPLDFNAAQQKLAQAGWVKNAQGELVSQTNGERFDFELRSFQEGPAEKNLATIADGWQKVGARVEQFVVPGALNSDAEYRNTLPGGSITGQIWDMMYTSALDSRVIAGPLNRWNGSNRAGYNNPRVDDLYDKLAITVNPDERVALHKTLLQEVFGDAAYIPLYWEYSVTLALKNVRGVGGLVDNSSTWNIFEWNKD